MSLYNYYPPSIKLDAIKHIPLTFLVNPDNGVSESLNKAVSNLGSKSIGDATDFISNRILEHTTYISRPANNIPGFTNPDGTLINALSEFLIANKEKLESIWNIAFGDARSVLQQELTIQQVLLLDLVSSISMYTIALVDITSRLMILTALNASNDASVHATKIHAKLDYMNNIRANLREILMHDNYMDILEDASTTVASPVFLQVALANTGAPSFFSVNPGNTILLFSSTSHKVRVYKTEALDNYKAKLSTISEMIQMYSRVKGEQKNTARVTMHNKVQELVSLTRGFSCASHGLSDSP